MEMIAAFIGYLGLRFLGVPKLICLFLFGLVLALLKVNVLFIGFFIVLSTIAL